MCIYVHRCWERYTPLPVGLDLEGTSEEGLAERRCSAGRADVMLRSTPAFLGLEHNLGLKVNKYINKSINQSVNHLLLKMYSKENKC